MAAAPLKARDDVARSPLGLGRLPPFSIKVEAFGANAPPIAHVKRVQGAAFPVGRSRGEAPAIAYAFYPKQVLVAQASRLRE